MIAITTSSSINVKPWGQFRQASLRQDRLPGRINARARSIRSSNVGIWVLVVDLNLPSHAPKVGVRGLFKQALSRIQRKKSPRVRARPDCNSL